MEWKDVAARILTAAPVLAGILGGPVGAGVSLAASLLQEKFGGDTPVATLRNINNDPDASVKLEQIESDNLKLLLQYKLDTQKLNEESVQNARLNLSDAALKKKALDIFGYTLCVFILIFTACMIFDISISTSEVGLLAALSQALRPIWDSLMKFLFGS